MADAAPGRFAIGIGSSSNVIVERWNDIPFEEPYKKTRDMVRFLRKALTGDIRGLRVGVVRHLWEEEGATPPEKPSPVARPSTR